MCSRCWRGPVISLSLDGKTPDTKSKSLHSMDGGGRRIQTKALDFVSMENKDYDKTRNMWYISDIDSLGISHLRQVFENIVSGNDLAPSMHFLKDLMDAENGYNGQLLIDTGIIESILPLISHNNPPPLVINALELAIGAVKCEIPPGTSFENACLYDELNVIAHLCVKFRYMSLHLLCLLLQHPDLGPRAFAAIFSDTFVQDLPSLEIFENYRFDTVGVDVYRQLKTLKYAFRYVRLMASLANEDALPHFSPLIPCSISWLTMDFKHQKDDYQRLFMVIKGEVFSFLTVILANAQNRNACIESGLIDVLMTTIHKNANNNYIVGVCFDCITELCEKECAIPPRLQSEGFLYLIRGAMQSVNVDGLEHIVKTLQVFLHLMSCDILWEVEVVQELLPFLSGTLSEMEKVVPFLLDFCVAARVDIKLQMLQGGFLDTMIDCMMSLPDDDKLQFLNFCSHLLTCQQTARFVTESKEFQDLLFEMAVNCDETVSAEARSISEAHGF